MRSGGKVYQYETLRIQVMVAVLHMKYCGHCVMPAFVAIENGLADSAICNACKNAFSTERIDWTNRRKLLVDLVAPYRTDSNYEIVIGVSGG